MIGMMTSPTSDETIAPKAAPMMTPTARSTTLPRSANFLNSSNMVGLPKGSAHTPPQVWIIEAAAARDGGRGRVGKGASQACKACQRHRAPPCPRGAWRAEERVGTAHVRLLLVLKVVLAPLPTLRVCCVSSGQRQRLQRLHLIEPHQIIEQCLAQTLRGALRDAVE